MFLACLHVLLVPSHLSHYCCPSLSDDFSDCNRFSILNSTPSSHFPIMISLFESVVLLPFVRFVSPFLLSAAAAAAAAAAVASKFKESGAKKKKKVAELSVLILAMAEIAGITTSRDPPQIFGNIPKTISDA